MFGTVSIPLFIPCRPVISVPRVVVHAGVAQALSKTMPLSASASSTGVYGRSVLRLYCDDASRPRSSEIINNILGCDDSAALSGVGTMAGALNKTVSNNLVNPVLFIV